MTIDTKAPRRGVKKKRPAQFERRGRAFIGFAVTIHDDDGNQIAVLAPNRARAADAAHALGLFDVDHRRIQKIAIIDADRVGKHGGIAPQKKEAK